MTLNNVLFTNNARQVALLPRARILLKLRTQPVVGALLLSLLAGCSSEKNTVSTQRPEQVRADIMSLMPANVADKQGWAKDISTAFITQKIDPTTENICAVLAVTEQESNFNANAPVPGLGKIAWKEIDRRAAEVHIPAFLVHTALKINSPNGKSYSDRLDNVRSEKELSAIFDDFIGMVPMGQKLFGNLNPVHTGGPMQVSVAFAESKASGYPYPIDGTIRREVFSRRGGMYFGIAHLLGYPTHYSEPIYRFADYNAGFYASRNAAFQQAVSRLSGVKLALDGDVVSYSDTTGKTEMAVRRLSKRLSLSNSDISRDLRLGESIDFEKTPTWKLVFALADKTAGKKVPREMLPGIELNSPKITRNLTTAWFAQRVDERRRQCLTRG
ncbi:DUF1615 domain-containing protein [Rouxiella badensis]|uniref:DUF1615 domain-containing protein n=1 Tax=Rouxiella badensis TaxID=1646377 RepID=UPI0022A9FD85|nr:DUF1615 domain-containing protein [Rouxiella badensis]WAT09164.1 DUF1615 domain-containing protein [Rouxiella badensis]